MNIYQDGSYAIDQTGQAMATVTNGPQTVRVRLETPSPMPARMTAALRKSGMNPADYFFAGGSVLRAAAKQDWESAVAAVDLRDNARKVAHAEAARIGAEVEAEREVGCDSGGHPALYLRMVRPDGSTYTAKAGM